MELLKLIESSATLMDLKKKKIKTEEVKKLLDPLDYHTVLINGEDIKDRDSLFRTLSESLNFPSYFGYNWDALEDCLRSLPEFTKRKKHAIIIGNSVDFLKGKEDDLRAFLEISEECGDFLREKYQSKLKIIML